MLVALWSPCIDWQLVLISVYGLLETLDIISQQAQSKRNVGKQSKETTSRVNTLDISI
jgi:hypothetical protein